MAQTLDISLLAYPTLTEAAGLLSVSASTLSRRGDLSWEPMGERDKRIPAAEVMRLAAVYRKRSLNEIAADLIDYAGRQNPDCAAAVEQQVERFFEERQSSVMPAQAFLAEAKRALPAELYGEVERVYRAAGGERPPALVSAD